MVKKPRLAKAAGLSKLAEGLLEEPYFSDACAALQNNDKDAFFKVCVAAGLVDDDNAGKKLAHELFKFLKEMMEDGTWGWD